MAQLALFGGEPVLKKPRPHHLWPRITPEIQHAVVSQLYESVSIYDRSGIFEEFEEYFRQKIGKDYALLTSSGTSALHTAFEAINLNANDEVIVPAYTFFATASPIAQFGSFIRQVDANEFGNIDPSSILNKINDRTKAIIITHMWGHPCASHDISKIAKQHDIYLIEDCSHAHGATINGQPVGLHGDISIWSLQGQKNITGGEGGILLTSDQCLFERAVLFGHYNKRAKQQVSHASPLAKFVTTGFGLKLRAHPLAIAMAYEQLKSLEHLQEARHKHALRLRSAIDKYPFIKTPPIVDTMPSWYALIFNYNESISKVSIDLFVKALLAEGLLEIDRPRSTGYLSMYPLFTHTQEAINRLYNTPMLINADEPQINAELFYATAIKLPVWAHADENFWVEDYVRGLTKVCDAVSLNPEIFHEER